jgi:hypothetical protein
METDVIAAPPEVAENLAPVDGTDARETLSAEVVGLPNASCSCTVMGPSDAVVEAVPDTGADVNTNLDAAADATLNAVLVVDVSPLLVAVSV